MSSLAVTQEPRPYKFFRELESTVAPFRKSLKRFTIIHAGLIGAKEYLIGAINEREYSWITNVKLISGFVFVFSIPKIIISTQLAISSKSLIEKIEHVANAIITAGVLTGSFATCVEALKALHYLPCTSFSWTPIVSSLFLPFQVISLELNASKISESYAVRNQVITVFPTLKKNMGRDHKINMLTEACNFIIEHKRNLEKSLEISKKDHLDQKAQEILLGLQAGNSGRKDSAMEDGIHLLEALKARASAKYNVSIASGVSKAVALTASTISLLFLSVTAGWIALAFVASVSCAVSCTEKLMLQKHLFPT